ncbi:MAG: 4Fe-4S dicluster domain-containing protein [Anaerolineae bacterium]|nr:4Fe-4S dicluster domain-containing protein [Anaerolineae bacterium]
MSAVELVDENLIELARNSPFRRLTHWIEGNPQAILVVEVSGDTEAEVRAKLEKVIALDIGQNALVRADTPQAVADVWAVRKVGLGILMSNPGDHKPLPFIEDAAVPVEHLADYVRELHAMVKGIGRRVVQYAHASAGELHIRPVLNLKDPADVEAMQQIAQASFEMVKRLGGATADEHGDGITRSGFNRMLYGDALFDRMAEVKRLFDPDDRLNPDRVISAPPLGENLRYGPSYRTTPPAHPLYFDWSRWGGFAGAVEMCNRSGECRQLEVGVMCPSFKATREESDSTRGRANALRAALSGKWPGGLTDEGIKQVLDLCLECKACKSECPSSVDMARMKSEWLAQYYRDHGTPLRSWIFGNYGMMSRLAQPFAPLVNRAINAPLVRRPVESLLGIKAERHMPTFTTQTIKQWYNRRAAQSGPNGRPEVVLFPDCYIMFNYPDIGKAAIRALEALGYHVRLGPDICCGRTMISKGLLGRARAQGSALWPRWRTPPTGSASRSSASSQAACSPSGMSTWCSSMTGAATTLPRSASRWMSSWRTGRTPTQRRSCAPG